MSWLARSIAKTLELEGDKEPYPIENQANFDGKIDKQQDPTDSTQSQISPGRGVKEDISELTQTLSRQFWGVASFLAPPPPPPQSPLSEVASDSGTHEPSDLVGTSGIRSDFAEIGGKFKTGISKLSSNLAVSEFTKMASNFLQLGEEEEDNMDSDAARGVAGVTDEVLAFARDISMHPETWLDFPLPDNEDDEDFDLSYAQQVHALAVEKLVPQLASLRFELSQGYMSDSCFWKIYFVLLHPRLDKQAAGLLTTTEIVKARALLTQGLQNTTKAKQDWSGRGTSYSADANKAPDKEHLPVPATVQSDYLPLEISALDSGASTSAPSIEREKYPVVSSKIPVVDKSVVVQERPMADANKHKSSDVRGDDSDDWLKEETTEVVGVRRATIPINEEDISFSDLEEDDGDGPTSDKRVVYSSDSSTKDSPDWVQLGRSSVDSAKDGNSVALEHGRAEHISSHHSDAKESNDWLNVDDIDVA